MLHKWKYFFLMAASLVVMGCKESALFYTTSWQRAVFTQTKAESSFDFLWVLDNSGSMKPRRDYLRDNLANFLDTLNSRKAINYQMAVVTTDAFRDNGALIKSSSGIEVVRSATSNNPAADFSEVVNSITDSTTSFWEQGLENSLQAVQKNGSKFSRPGVPLVIVYLTDEEDFSCQSQCWGVEPERNTGWTGFGVQRYSDFFKQYKSGEGSEVILFPIVGVNQERCPVPSVGARYAEVSGSLGNYGKEGSICDSDLAESYNNIAKIIADRGSVFKLPQPADPESILVYVDKKLEDPAKGNVVFDVSQNAIIFQNKLPAEGSVIEVLFDEKN